ncbi:unnamed protein product [Blepharisma stoltei]|uniref:Uncharacterized protein n=1 Tax=Blepharisma stoltei TaxID=1481888 RepID=A0AAU9IP61_9CILI|nr:unnamed protein product [Blepharisma stoltei]
MDSRRDTRTNSLPSSPPGEDAAQDCKKKIAIMKKAVLMEREAKQKDLELADSLQKKLGMLNLTLAEKDSQIKTMNEERERLEQELTQLKERNKNGSSSPAKVPKKSVATLEQQNKKLLEEYHFLKQENQDLQTMYATINQACEEIQKEIKSKDDTLRKTVSELQAQLADTLRQQESLEKDMRDAQMSYNNLLETEKKLKADLEMASNTYQAIEEEIQVIKQEILVKQGQIARLNERLLKQGENEAMLSNKLMQYKNELEEAESYYQKHDVTKINHLINRPATIELKRNHTGEYIIEIEEHSNKYVYDIKSIESVFVHPNSERRFYIKFIDNNLMEFQSNSAEQIASKIKNFLTRANSAGPRDES